MNANYLNESVAASERMKVWGAVGGPEQDVALTFSALFHKEHRL